MKHRTTLSDDIDFRTVTMRRMLFEIDDDAEQGAWPEVVDQRFIGRHIDAQWNEDDEVDDDDRSIDDVPHDVLDEDGF